MPTRTLSIMRVYFDAIADGTKTTEYRACKPYFRWLETMRTPFMLKLHYQRGPQLVVVVERIRQQQREDWMDRAIIPTETVWALDLGRLVSVTR